MAGIALDTEVRAAILDHAQDAFCSGRLHGVGDANNVTDAMLDMAVLTAISAHTPDEDVASVATMVALGPDANGDFVLRFI